jgi:hypothetical protein
MNERDSLGACVRETMGMTRMITLRELVWLRTMGFVLG